MLVSDVQRMAVSFWDAWTAPVPMPARWSKAWWWEVGLVRNTVYALTGSTVRFFVKPAVRHGLQSTTRLREGSRGLYAASALVTLSIYPVILLSFGTVLGRHHYFKAAAKKMLRRIPGAGRLSERSQLAHAKDVEHAPCPPAVSA